MEQVHSMFRDIRWTIPEDFLTRPHFERVVKRLDWTSSPGYPYLLQATSNGDFFKVSAVGEPREDRMDIIWNIVQSKLRGDDADPIRLFVKPEPHTQRKLEEERYRLISSVSVIDQIVDHMLFDEMNDMMIQNWFRIPNKAGWSVFGGGWRHLPYEDWMAMDASSWDWTVRPWLLEMCLSLRVLCCQNMQERWFRLAERRYIQLFTNPVFVTSGGLMLRQLTPGVMKSGCVNTISDNSMMQVILHVRVSMELGIPVYPLFVMGDDRLQQIPQRTQEYIDLTNQYCIVKSCTVRNEFAGFRFFRGGRVEPVHCGKHAFSLRHVVPTVLPQLANSYMLNYHRSQHAGFFQGLFSRLGMTLYSDAFRDLVYDGL